MELFTNTTPNGLREPFGLSRAETFRPPDLSFREDSRILLEYTPRNFPESSLTLQNAMKLLQRAAGEEIPAVLSRDAYGNATISLAGHSMPLSSEALTAIEHSLQRTLPRNTKVPLSVRLLPTSNGLSFEISVGKSLQPGSLFFPLSSSVPTSPPSLVPHLFQELLRATPHLSLPALRSSLTAQGGLPSSAAPSPVYVPVTSSNSAPPLATNSPFTQLAKQLLVTEEIFRSPKQLAELLQRAASPSPTPRGPQKTEIPPTNTARTRSSSIEQLLQKAMISLEKMISTGTERGTSISPRPSPTLPLPSNHTPHQRTTESESTPPEHLPTISRELTPLLHTLREVHTILSHFPSSTLPKENDPSFPLPSSTFSFLEKTLRLFANEHTLRSLIEQRAPSSSLQALAKDLKSLRTQLQNALANPKESTQSPAEANALAASNGEQLSAPEPQAPKPPHLTEADLKRLAGMAENFVQGQESLRRLNPLMQQIGEPIFLLLPGLLQGFLSRLEVSMSPLGRKQSHQKTKSKKDFDRIRSTFTFPNIGAIQVNASFSDTHLLLSLTSEDEEITELLDAQLHRLHRRLRTLGFHRLELITRTTP
ncbi:hypothetical protein MRY87_10010, partial [bacterium]|nr:hypothetical protein [bacterium]